ncbi:hypothetical protein JKP88DRAFT_158959 [Tribonema minus]|uniref:Uncharacterized protein n=1 Tax=Tribonema minus TaxID=303371 RepID=A0A836CAN6_9STRA|nr:hypothetical protein JKP88DRAFT_158959 [Tribonema minus]
MTLQAVPADEHGINIFVKSLSGKTFTVHGLSCSDTVDTIMEAVEDKEGVLNLFDEQRLVFAGQQLETGRTLYEHRIQNDSTLHMMGRLRGGSSSLAPLKIPFADVSKTSAIQHIRFSPDAPSWRTVVTGLNLEGYCRNPRCAARNELVIANVGMDAFTLGARCACPQCSSAILPHTCGFYACTWKYEGAKTDGVFMCSPWYTAGDTAYDLVNEHGNMALWSRLVLVAKPIASGAKDKDGRAVPNDCGLCLMSLAESENTAVRNCGHRYHATCLTRWQQQYSGGSHRSTCPACRAQHHGASASA